MTPIKLTPDTVRIFVRDLAAAREFYGEKLALPPGGGSIEHGFLVFEPGRVSLVLEACGNDAESISLVGRFVGLSFRVPDVNAAYEELIRRGVRFAEPPERQPWGGVLAHLRDPDGNVLTLVGDANASAHQD